MKMISLFAGIGGRRIMKMISLFAGIGGFDLAGRWAGWETVVMVEKDPFCQQVLKKNFAGVPIHGDIKEFDGTGYAGAVDIICGGFPCQPFSVAGKRKGTDDDRHLWPEMLRVIREVKPTWVIGENVGGFLTIDGGMAFEQTCLDLEAEGYEVQTFVIPAVAVNAPHRRDRVWIIAHAKSRGCNRWEYLFKTFGEWTNNETPSHSDIMRPQEPGYREQTSGAGQSDENAINPECGGQSGNAWRGSGQEFENGHIGAEQVAPDTSTKGLQRDELARASESGERTSRSAPKFTWDDDWIEVAAALCRVDDGLPVRMDGFELSKSGHRRERLKSLGNSIVPQVAYEIFKAINEVENAQSN